MSDAIVLGTDTDAGKTTFALLWMAAFPEDYAYWKPVETGPSDTETVERLVPDARVHTPLARFRDAVAPEVAAEREGRSVPEISEILDAVPEDTRSLLIETFGSALSPLRPDVLQIELIRRFERPSLLVGSTAVGAVGRALQSIETLRAHGIEPRALVLVGPADTYAESKIRQHGGLDVFSLEPPATFDEEGVRLCAEKQIDVLRSLYETLETLESGQSVDKDWVGRDRRSVWHPYTSLKDPDEPLNVVDSRDEFLILEDGRQIIDGFSSWWTIQHAHRYPPLMKALREAARRYDHVVFAGATHPPAIELAERMLATMPWSGGRVFYSDNGSTAVEVALKLAYQFWCHRGEPGRRLFVGFEGGYHGDTFGAMAVSRDPLFFGTFEPLLFESRIVPLAPKSLNRLLEREGSRVAAVIIEPLVQGAGGMLMHSPETLAALADVARKHGVIFIADEVMTGGGRTGTLWAHQAAGITPDLVCAGKTIAGGILPIATTLVAPHIVEAFDTEDRSRTFFHGHSFTAHPLSCAVGVANWRLMENGIGKEPRQIESFWRERIEPMRSRPGVKDVRIQGTIAAIELDLPGGYLADAGRPIRQVCLERGVYLRPLGNVLYALPPFRTSRASLEQIADAMEAALAEVLEASNP